MQAHTTQIRKSITIVPTTPARTTAHIAPDLADLTRLSIRQVSALVGLCDQSIRDRIKSGRFPPADHRDGPRCVRWSAGLIRRWLESTGTAVQ
ncbi:MAG: hypothetical protein RL260_2636 [Pseudomonadota bacterium]|jgi:predicted DNA-binding transcriptional regulator AlpA